MTIPFDGGTTHKRRKPQLDKSVLNSRVIAYINSSEEMNKMEREFNVTGICVPDKHYMVNVANKFKEVMKLIEKGKYFAINRPRQYGKTTMLFNITKVLRQDDKYILSKMSFEGIGDTIFENEHSFSPRFVGMLADSLEMFDPETAATVLKLGSEVTDLETLSKFITKFVRKVNRDVVLLIDEVDKASNNQLFVSFLAMLRDKYLKRDSGDDFTFQSIILAGVHDVKSLKLKLREGEEVKINSPWNIAADFNVDMSFNPAEIKTMLVDYAEDKGVEMDFDAIAERIRYYTSGYPFLVSKICKNIDEEEADQNPDYDPRHWTLDDIDWSFRWLTREDYTTTNFDDLTKNLENHPDLFRLVNAILFDGPDKGLSFSVKNPLVNLGLLYGMFKGKVGRTVIHNRIYEQILSDYMRSKEETALKTTGLSGYDLGYDHKGHLDMNRILLKFQEFMKEHASDRDEKFLEREGRMVFMSFLKPIVNGKGFMWKEPVVNDERRMDIVVTFGNKQKEVIELKIWRGEKYHQRGLQQLSDYLNFQSIKTGYLLIFDFNKNKQYSSEQISFADKEIFAVRV